MNKYYQALCIPTALITMGLTMTYPWIGKSLLWLVIGAGGVYIIQKYIADEKCPLPAWVLLSLSGPLGAIALSVIFSEEINNKFSITKNE